MEIRPSTGAAAFPTDWPALAGCGTSFPYILFSAAKSYKRVAPILGGRRIEPLYITLLERESFMLRWRQHYNAGMVRGEMATVAEAAEALGITKRAVLLRIERGEMTAEKISPHFYLIPRSEVERWKPVGKRKGGRPPKPRDGE